MATWAAAWDAAVKIAIPVAVPPKLIRALPAVVAPVPPSETLIGTDTPPVSAASTLVPSLYKMADAFVLPLRGGEWAAPVMEAMALPQSPRLWSTVPCMHVQAGRQGRQGRQADRQICRQVSS